MIQKERIKALNNKEMKKGAYVLYWKFDIDEYVKMVNKLNWSP